MAKAKKEAKPAKAAGAAEPQAPAAPQRRPLSWLISPGSLASHPPGVLLADAIVLVVLVLVTLLTNNFLAALNAHDVFFIRPGSLLLLVFSIATLIYALKMIAHAFHAIARLRGVYKAVLFILIVMTAAWVFLNQDTAVPYIANVFRMIPWDSLNPLTFVIH
jgi:hypothetical protein